MPKTAIVYRSPHHGNTKKLLDALVSAHPEVTLLQAGKASLDLSPYNFIGFASGVYAGKLHRTVRTALDTIAPEGRKAFVIYTCGDKEGGKYGKRYLEVLRQKGFDPTGYFWCLGHDSFGPLRLIGGIHKDRPNLKDLEDAVAFYENLIN